MVARKPDSATDAWFKELENRLGALANRLSEAANRASRSATTNARIHRHLSLVQEAIAGIEDRIATLAADAGASSDGNGRDPALDAEASVTYCEVPGFPGYRVGSDGTIWGSRSAGRGYGRTRDWRQLKPYLVRPGPALTVSLYRDRKRHITRVDELVLLAFAGPCPSGCEVLHQNGDRLDNRPDNLRYVHSGAAASTHI